MILRTMYDSVNMDAIPLSAVAVAGYPHRSPTVWNPGRFPCALVMAIDQRGDHPDDCHAADVEGGDVPILVANIRSWVEQWHLHHPHGMPAQNGFFARPVVYCNEATLPAVQNALHGLAWSSWITAWPGPGPVLEPGWDAHQYASDTTGSGGDFDLSVISPGFGARPAPPSPPPSTWVTQAYAGVHETIADLAEIAGLIKPHLP